MYDIWLLATGLVCTAVKVVENPRPSVVMPIPLPNRKKDE
jgi:hypothetical protein